MKTYTGQRLPEGCVVTVHEGNLTTLLPPRLDLDNHSPTGFEWGYGGSGPAQLALAILADYLGDDGRARRLHQTFKWEVVARLASKRWRLDELNIEMFLRDHPQRRVH